MKKYCVYVRTDEGNYIKMFNKLKEAENYRMNAECACGYYAELMEADKNGIYWGIIRKEKRKMIDRDKVFKGLKCCADPIGECLKCPYNLNGTSISYCTMMLSKNALTLFKVQEKRIATIQVALDLANGKLVNMGYNQYTCDDGRKILNDIINAASESQEKAEKTKVVFKQYDGSIESECGNCGMYLGKAFSRCPKCNKELDWNGV